jgi:hypothetical protein
MDLDTLLEYKICLNCDLSGSLNYLSSYSCSAKLYKELRQHQGLMGPAYIHIYTFLQF